MDFVFRLDGTLPPVREPAHLLGGKGANLAGMMALGLPVPPGFTLTTEVCSWYYAHERSYPPGLEAEVAQALQWVERETGRTFGHGDDPLLLSVRSGARASMPGMMDTILNLGLNDLTVESLASAAGDARFAYDSYRRFIQMYGSVVLGISHDLYEAALAALKERRGVQEETALEAGDLQVLIAEYKTITLEQSGAPFPQDAHTQLWTSIGAVFSSWMNERAIFYRQLNAIPQEWGTAVNVQAMVFGNMGGASATGVAFTRDPSTGSRVLYGEFLMNAQGEDVVAGIRTPHPIGEEGRRASGSKLASMETLLPDAFLDLERVASLLESHHRDMQDIEFTVERGKLWVLQTRAGKRSAQAAVRIAVDLAQERVISREEAVCRVPPSVLDQLLHPTIDAADEHPVIARGLPASPGAACGRIVFSAADAEQESAAGNDVILVRPETSPEDIHGMHVAKGILTVQGGMTSHAAVVARGMGKPCVCGAEGLIVDVGNETLSAGEHLLKRGDIITLDGSSGRIIAGQVPMRQPDMSDRFAVLMEWADEIRTLGVRANAETPDDARTALRFGAEGIGLARTEHMFFEADRTLAIREMILADDAQGRQAALDRLLPMQRADFVELFDIMPGLPVTIRLLDPPLHEFLPHSDEEITEVASALGLAPARIVERIRALTEINPMLGFRGCRLAVAFPEITRMQATAVFEAVIDVMTRTGNPPIPEIMVPLVLGDADFRYVKEIVDSAARSIIERVGVSFTYHVGTMIELPRAALRAGEIAASAEFFSFGTNDLTQTALGISRDDAATFLGGYLSKNLLESDPFVSIDRDGVGELVHIAVERGRAVRPDIKLGICGEHGGDPASVEFCHKAGLDYVSCSPFRLPIARLAAAQAQVRNR